jgi:DtxR family Mn-dependent transcriptional regulator
MCENFDMPEELSTNMKKYLNAIYLLKKQNEIVRVNDLSELMNVRKSSVTDALKTLSKKGFVLHERYGDVDLTLKGKNLAEFILNCHDILMEFFTGILDVDLKEAKEDAQRIKYLLSSRTYRQLATFTEFASAWSEKQEI